MSDFITFMKRHRVKKGEPFTYVGMSSPKGCFNISEIDRDNFFSLYNKHVFVDKKDCDLIEKHDTLSCFLFDLDFKMESPVHLNHVYTDEFIIEFIRITGKLLSKYLDIPPKNFRAFIFEKDVDKPQSKDGIHIMFPYIVSYPSLQYLIREELLVNAEELLLSLSTTNPIEDVLDESIIKKNGWMMYGSHKPNCAPYLLTHIYDLSKENPERINASTYYVKTAELTRILSIRGAKMADLTPIHSAVQSVLSAWEINKESKEVESIKENVSSSIILNFYKHDISTVSKLVDILSVKRASSYKTWIEVGWCLHNIDYRLLSDWIRFSERINKYKDFARNECTTKWEDMKNSGLGIGSLHMWAKEDNDLLYSLIIQDTLEHHIVKSVSHKLKDKKKITKSTVDVEMIYHIVMAMKKKYGHFFICSSYSKRTWYEFTGIRWVEDDDDVGLKKKMREELYRDYMNIGLMYHGLAEKFRKMEEEHPNCEKYEDMSNCICQVASQLRDCSFRKKVTEEACEQLYWDREKSCKFENANFQEILDTNTHLVGLNNGVYDLNLHTFRSSRCEDYITLSTDLNWKEYEWTDTIIDEIRLFLSQIIPEEDRREYVLLTLASFLDGKIREEHFHIWLGSGGNGKSKLIELFEYSFGKYCAKLNIAALTQKRTGSSQASPDIARLCGKRFVVLQEPNEGENLQVGIMKEMTGGDKMVARKLHQEPFEFKPQFNMVCTCNQLPKVPADDGGTWRRIRVVKFTSVFKENPDAENPNEFPLDPQLGEKMKKWRHAFFWMLTEYYKKYRAHGLKEPECVKLSTKEYQMNNDIYGEFVENHIESVPKGVIYVDALYVMFQLWYRKGYPDRRCPSRKDLLGYMEKKYGSYYNQKKKGWRGLKLHEVREDEDDDDYDEDDDDAL